MPRTYIRKTEKAKWTSEDLAKALKSIQEGSSIRSASKTSGIPFSTLKERIKLKTLGDPSLGRKCDLPLEHEEALSVHVKKLSKVFYGLTPIKLRQIAYEYAEKIM